MTLVKTQTDQMQQSRMGSAVVLFTADELERHQADIVLLRRTYRQQCDPERVPAFSPLVWKSRLASKRTIEVDFETVYSPFGLTRFPGPPIRLLLFEAPLQQRPFSSSLLCRQ